MLKKISDNPYSAEKSAPPEMNWGVRERCFEEGKQAQLKADQKDLELVLLMQEGYMEQAKQAMVQEIFEGIEALSPFLELGNDLCDSAVGFAGIKQWDTYYPKIKLKDWQAFKQKWTRQ